MTREGKRNSSVFITLGAFLALAPFVFAQEAKPRAQEEIAVASMPSFKEAASGLAPQERLAAAAALEILMGRYREAAAELEQNASKRPDPQLSDLLAAAYIGLEDWPRAHAAAARAVALRPAEAWLYFNRGLAAFKLKDFGQAREDLSRYISGSLSAPPRDLSRGLLGSVEPDPRAYLYLGLSCLEQGDFEGARRDLLKAQDLEPALSGQVNYYLSVSEVREGKAAQASARLRQDLAASQEEGSAAREQERLLLYQLQKQAADRTEEKVESTLAAVDAENAAKHPPRRR